MNGLIKKKYARLLGLLTALLIAISPLAAHIEPMQAGAQDVTPLRGAVHEIRTPQQFADFLRGPGAGRGANYDTFVVMNDIDMRGVLPINPGRPGTFTGTLRGHVGEDGVRPVVTGVLLTHQGGPVEPPGVVSRRLNTGIIQEAGFGAVIEDIIFDDVILSEIDGVLTYPIGIGSLVGHVRQGGYLNITNVEVRNINLSMGHTLPTPNHANTRLGGMVGMVRETGRLTMTDVHAEGNLTTVDGNLARLNIAGGLVGENQGHLLVQTSGEGPAAAEDRNVVQVNIRRTGNVALFSHAGGVLGRVFTTPQTPTGSVSTRIEDTVVSATDIIGGNRVGGFIGETGAMGMVTIRDSAVIPAVNPPQIPVGTIQSTLRESDVGGFIGRAMTMTGNPTIHHIIIERVQNHANVIGAPNPALGATATAQGMREVGGIIGRNMAPTTITGAVNFGEIRHGVMRTQANAAGRTGGIVGRSSAPLHINHSVNAGNVLRSATVQTAGSNTGGMNAHVSGGIVGWVEHSGTIGSNQVVRLNTVTNHGVVAGSTRAAGGIIGRVTHGAGAGSVTHVYNAVNRGMVRGHLEVGGIIGGVRAASDVRVDGRTRNYGHIWPTGQAHVGGVIGFINGPRAVIEQTSNAGRVRQHPGTTTTGRGTGGIIGENRSNGLIMREVFNEGTITSQNSARTGGLIGWQAAGGVTTIEDFFVTGVVRTNSIQLRNAGSGVIGSRTTGQMIVRRGYVATRANGHLVAQDARREDGRAIRNTQFNQVYVVNTIGIPSPDMRPGVGPTAARRNEGGAVNVRNRLHILQPGIAVIGADLLATGLIPGVNHTLTGPWRVGVAGHAHYQATLPYFAWQTRHTASGLQEMFFEEKGDYRHHLYGIAPTSGSQDFVYSGMTFGAPNDLNYGIVRHFDPRGWGWEARTATNACDEAANRPIITAANGYVRAFNIPTGRVISGFISPNHVVTFGEAAIHDLFIVQAIDMDCPFQSPIEHAQMIAGPGVTILAEGNGMMFTRAEMITLPWWVSAQALGYELMMPPSVPGQGDEPGRLYLTQDDVDAGFINIPMRRVPIDRDIYVFVRDGSHDIGEVDNVQPNLWVAGTHLGRTITQDQANTTVFHHTERVRNTLDQWAWDDVQERVVRLQGDLVEPPAIHIHPVGTGQGNVDDPRPVVGVRGPLPRGTVTIGDPWRAGSAGFDWFDPELGFAIHMIDDLHASGPLTVTMELDNIALPPGTPVRLVEMVYCEEEGDDVETLIPASYNPAIDVRHPDNVNPPLDGRPYPTWTGDNPFALTGATLLSEILATANGFATVGWDIIELHYNEYIPAEDGEPAVPAHITIVMERWDPVILDVHVVEETDWGTRLIRNSTLETPIETLTSETGIFEDVIAEAGDRLVASADRFVDNDHVVAEGDTLVEIPLTREYLDPGTIAGFVWNAAEREAGIPVPGALVRLLDSNSVEVDRTTADEDGFFEFTGLEAGEYRLLGTAEGFEPAFSVVDPVVLVDGEPGVWADIYLPPLDPTDPRPYLLTIDVVCEDTGDRITAATVTFNSETVTRAVTWDVRLAEATGGYARASAPGFRLGAVAVDAADFVDRFQAVTIELEALPPGATGIQGFVSNAANGHAIAGATVVIRNAAGTVVATLTTNELGIYDALDLAPGTFSVRASAEGFVSQQRTGIVVAQDQVVQVDFALVAGDDCCEDPNLCPGCEECFNCGDIVPCPDCDDDYCEDCCECGVVQTQPLTVRNAPAVVATPTVPVGQTPSREAVPVNELLEWRHGTPAPAECGGTWYFLDWAYTAEGLVVGQPIPADFDYIKEVPERKPNQPTVAYALWGDRDGNFGQPQPPEPGEYRLTVNNIPATVTPTGQTESGLRLAGSTIPWAEGTLAADSVLRFAGWSLTQAGLTPGTVPTGLLTTPQMTAQHGVMPAEALTVWAVWVCRDTGEIPTPTRALTVSNFGAPRPANQSPVSNTTQGVDTALTWIPGSQPAPSELIHWGWTRSVAGLEMNTQAPLRTHEMWINPQEVYPRMPNRAVTVYAVWTCEDGYIGGPPARDIDVDVDEDGNVTITPPNSGTYDRDDDTGEITVTIPGGGDDNITVNLPCDDEWEYDKTVNDDGDVVIVITPPNRLLTVTNEPARVNPVSGQTPVTGEVPVGATVGPWVGGTTAAADLTFWGWALPGAVAGLVPGEPIPENVRHTPPTRMPGTAVSVVGLWAGEGGVWTPYPPQMLTVNNLGMDRPDDQRPIGGLRVPGSNLGEWIPGTPAADSDLTFHGWVGTGHGLVMNGRVPAEDSPLWITPPATMPNAALIVYAVWACEDGYIGGPPIPGQYMLTVRNHPAGVAVTTQTASGQRAAGSPITWAPGTPANTALEFGGWVLDSAAHLEPRTVPTGLLTTPQLTAQHGVMPATPLTVYAVWLLDGRIPCCNDPDICPGDDCDECFNCGPYEPCVDCGKCPTCCDDCTAPVTHALVVNNFPANVTVTGQTPASNPAQQVNSNLPWNAGTVPNMEFLGWVDTDARLVVGQPFPEGDRITPPATMPNNALTVWAVWGADGIVGERHYQMTVTNAPARVATTGQTPQTSMIREGATLTWAQGTPNAPAEGGRWYFLGWSDRGNWPVGQPLPEGAALTTPQQQAAMGTMPGNAVTRFALWGDSEGNFGVPEIPPVEGPNIDIDIDEDGNVTITPPDAGDYERDDDGTIIIVLPPDTDEDDVTINLPGDDWEYDVDRDEDGNLIITVTPPFRSLVVTNLPATVARPANQTPVSGSFRVGAVLGPWNAGTPAAPAGGGRWYFLGWASTDQGLVVGQRPPANIMIPAAQLPTLMPGAGFRAYALWGDRDGNFGRPQPPADDRGPQGPAGPQGPPGAPGADGRPVPKTGDTANMSLWMMLFMLGFLGLASTGTMLARGRRRELATPTMFIMRDENGKEQFIVK